MKQRNIVLMVVAVGCGLVAAFLTSQMSAKPTVIEKVDVIVAAKDLSVGKTLTKDELKTHLKRKSIAKEIVPPDVIETEEEFLEKRLSRNIRADEMISKKDLTKGGVVSIPAGKSMVSLPINLSNAVHGFVLPGSKVDVLASVRLSNNVRVLPILVNMLVLAVDANPQAPANSPTVASLSTVSFAVDRDEALLIQLARARHCEMTLLLRNQQDKDGLYDKGYKIEEVIKLLQKGEIKDPGADEPAEGNEPKKANPMPMMPTEPAPSPAPKIEIVKIPAAKEDIAAGTLITNDLIAEKFHLVELPKDLAADAVADLAPLVDDKQVLRTGLGKGQWLTKSLFGRAEPKPSPRDEFTIPKPGPKEEKPAEVKPKPEAKKTFDVAIHSATGTKYYRYEESANGERKLIGQVFPNSEKTTPTPEKVD